MECKNQCNHSKETCEACKKNYDVSSEFYTGKRPQNGQSVTGYLVKDKKGHIQGILNKDTRFYELAYVDEKTVREAEIEDVVKTESREDKMDDKKDVFELRYKGPTGGDETAPYYVDLKKVSTLDVFIDAVLKDKREWGSINIYNKERTINCSINYQYGKAHIPEKVKEYLNTIVIKANAIGGWSRMDYMLEIADIKNTSEPRVYLTHEMYGVMEKDSITNFAYNKRPCETYAAKVNGNIIRITFSECQKSEYEYVGWKKTKNGSINLIFPSLDIVYKYFVQNSNKLDGNGSIVFLKVIGKEVIGE